MKMKMKINSLCLVLSLCALFSIVTSITRRSYGEECNKIHKCDKTAWLYCRNEKCDCSKPDEMLYDEQKKTCVTKSGERCKYGIDDSEESTLVEVTECVPNAVCSSDGVCLCQSKYHEIYNGTCGLSKLFGENCSEEDQCSKYVGLHCVDSKCQCQDGVYSEEKGLCVGLSQNDCLKNECVEGAVCVQGTCLCDSEYFHSAEKTCLAKKSLFENCKRDVECLQTANLNFRCISGKCNCAEKFGYARVQKYEYGVHNRYTVYGGYKPFAIGFTGPLVEMCAPVLGEKCPDGYCLENAFCNADIQDSYSAQISGTCKCINEQFSPNKDLQYCAKSFDQKCDEETDCIDDLVCSAGKCNCPLSRHQFFDFSTNTCVTKVGGHCSNTSTCVPNSECAFLSSTNRSGHCRCKNDFVENEDRTCDRSYGTHCNEINSNCDTAAGLLCINNKCSCPDGMYQYNPKFRKCLGLVGAFCNNSEESITCEENLEYLEKSNICNPTSQSELTCIVNAYCKKKHSRLEAECECIRGYVEADNHTCVAISETTNTSVMCDAAEFRCGDLRSCIPMKSRCDGKTDCLDHSDEQDCNTKVVNVTNYYNETCYLHMCENGQCIRNEWICDGIVHCDDNSDEMDCQEIAAKNISTGYGKIQVCSVDRWTCRNGQCIPRSYFCDIGAECADQSDEPEGCEQTAECGRSFRCSSGGCIERRLLCDSVKHCVDGSDETICAM